ncbi:hypothetical protein ACFQU2_11395 [Siccirubricoccus deserti]|uniref:Uncharacterized protein n=1 Tax=Siccirubricoccus deserti TaxID=2013562 RepID=A0A9X0QVZ2_9PROT|nr:hypothetical protein [Siccirubricoccus deserti]MBC4013923.1 hypothetical protein [Siccirubricoccus deserti]
MLRKLLIRAATPCRASAAGARALRRMQDCGCRHVPVTEGERLPGNMSQDNSGAAEQNRQEAEGIP